MFLKTFLITFHSAACKISGLEATCTPLEYRNSPILLSPCITMVLCNFTVSLTAVCKVFYNSLKKFTALLVPSIFAQPLLTTLQTTTQKKKTFAGFTCRWVQCIPTAMSRWLQQKGTFCLQTWSFEIFSIITHSRVSGGNQSNNLLRTGSAQDNALSTDSIVSLEICPKGLLTEIAYLAVLAWGQLSAQLWQIYLFFPRNTKWLYLFRI